MTMTLERSLGDQPVPLLGDPIPDYGNDARAARVEMVLPFFRTNYIEHAPQTEAITKLLTYIRSTLPLLGGQIYGRGLSEDSNAGKSRMIEQLVCTAAKIRADQGLPPNPHQIIVVELDRNAGIFTFYRQILRRMGDPHYNDRRSDLEELEDRINTLGRKLGVEAIVGDEVQHLARKTTTSEQVTDRLKTFLNRGVLCLILVGDEMAETFFRENPKFASRLGTPLRLAPIDVRARGRGRELFLKFCAALDTSMVDAGIVDQPAGLVAPGMRSQLATVSGGHVGRVCRLVCEAAQHALWRGSPMVERHDLSVATREYAMGLNWIHRDPFSRPPQAVTGSARSA